jgi:hypothetical protein
MVLVTGLVVGTGGGAAPVVAPVVQTVATGAGLTESGLLAGAVLEAAGASSAGASAVAAVVSVWRRRCDWDYHSRCKHSCLWVCGSAQWSYRWNAGAGRRGHRRCRNDCCNDGRRRQQLESGRVDHLSRPCRRRSMRATHCHMELLQAHHRRSGKRSHAGRADHACCPRGAPQGPADFRRCMRRLRRSPRSRSGQHGQGALPASRGRAAVGRRCIPYRARR